MPTHAVQMLVLSLLAVLVLGQYGRLITTDLRTDLPVLETLPAVSPVQCGVRCLLHPLCVGVRLAEPAGGGGGVDCTLVTCPPEWNVTTSGCYGLYPQTDVDWFTSEYACNSLGSGSHLVSLNTWEENEAVSAFSQSIGVFQYTQMGLFWPLGATHQEAKWTDGTPFIFESWFPGHPNQPHDEEMVTTVLMAHNRLWMDWPVSFVRNHARICELWILARGYSPVDLSEHEILN